MRLRERLASLEARSSGVKRWHVIRRFSDQTEDEAVALYEAKNGVIDQNEGSLFCVILNKPFPTPAEA